MRVQAPIESDRYAIMGGLAPAETFEIATTCAAFKILSEGLYSDKHRAVVREVLCNAVDAHIEAGIDQPVEITLSDSELVIRDFGRGIPHDKIKPIYLTYFSSTKTKDEAQTGGFGLGSKAPFAYTDHFTVTSCHAGMRRVYALHVGDSDTNDGAPAARLMVETPCGEEQGLTVSIPIEKEDRFIFNSNIAQVVMDGGMNVKLNGDVVPTRDLTNLRKHGYAMHSHSYHYILYGNVRYPFDERDGRIRRELGKLQSLIPYSAIELYAPPSSIAVTPSREFISFNDTTVKTVNKLLRKARHEILNRINEILRTELREKIAEAGRDKFWSIKPFKQEDFYGNYFVGADEVARWYLSSKTKGMHHLFASAALHVFRDNRKSLALVKKDKRSVSRDNFRYLARRAWRLAKTAGLEDRVFFKRTSESALSSLRKVRLGIATMRIWHPELTIVTSRELAMNMNKKGFFLVQSKIKDDQLLALAQACEHFGFDWVAMSPFDQKKEKDEPKEAEVKPDEYRPINVNYTRRGRYNGSYYYAQNKAPLPGLPTAFVYFQRVYTKDFGNCFCGPWRNDVYEKLLAITPKLGVALTATEAKKYIEKGVPSIDDVLVGKFDQIIGKFKGDDSFILALANYVAKTRLAFVEARTPQRLIRDLTETNIHLAFVALKLNPISSPELVKETRDLTRLISEWFTGEIPSHRFKGSGDTYKSEADNFKLCRDYIEAQIQNLTHGMSADRSRLFMNLSGGKMDLQGAEHLEQLARYLSNNAIGDHYRREDEEFLKNLIEGAIA